MTDGHLLDTCAAAWLVQPDHPSHAVAMQHLSGVSTDLLFISIVSLGENEYGIQVSDGWDVTRQLTARQALARFTCLPINSGVVAEYGRIRAALFRQYAKRNPRGRLTERIPDELAEPASARLLGIQENDLWILSTAVAHNLRFVTGDRQFGMRRVVQAADYGAFTQFWPGRVSPTTAD